MKLFRDIPSLVHFMGETRLKGNSVGLVPTMGYLHQGHFHLIKSSVKENDITVCSIFVNPTQFNNPEDLKNYPRNEKTDLELLEKANCSAVFIPDVDEIYNEERIVNFNFGYLEEIMEGKFRPHHFKGVGLIVCKLFNLVNPNRAYFGTKDLQQLVLIKKIVEELNYNIEIRPIETIREKNGLALSSRNARLSLEEKEQSLILFDCLNEAKKLFHEKVNINRIREVILEKCKKSSFFALEYFEIVNSETLLPIVNIDTSIHVSACIAGYIGKVRLIDNISII